MEPILNMISITKYFGTLAADDQVNLQVNKGEIHSLLGENGAGKTTLMNILYGLYKPDEGEIYFEGKKMNFHSAKDAIHAGIGMIHQHFMLVPVHTVLENIIMGMTEKNSRIIDHKKSAMDIMEIAKKYGMDIVLNAKVSELSVGAQQRVEIVKALYRGAKLLIMDEPTAVLTPQETTELFTTLKRMASSGMSIILITHKLKEVLSVSDRVTILRDGRAIKTVNTVETNEMELTKLMIGRELVPCCSKNHECNGNVVLELRNVMSEKVRGIHGINDISLVIQEGEILGIAGVDGNGQKELAEMITGLARKASGDILLDGVEIGDKKIRDITNMGVSYIPEDRHKRGLILDFSICENVILQVYDQFPYAKGGFLDFPIIEKHTEDIISRYGIKTPGKHAAARKLSGGNQQKIVVAREIERYPKLLVAVQPTRGVDIGASEFIHQQILKEKERGAAVLLISTELSEINMLSDRVSVMYKGQIMGTIDHDEFDENIIGLMMAGIPLDKALQQKGGTQVV